LTDHLKGNAYHLWHHQSSRSHQETDGIARCYFINYRPSGR